MFGKKHPKLEIVIGSESLIRGEISSKGTVRIDGTFEGNIAADCLIIGETGAVTGDIVSKILITGGKITGTVRSSETVEIQHTGEVYGDIHTARLTIAEGAVFQGHSSMQKSRGEIEFRPSELPQEA